MCLRVLLPVWTAVVTIPEDSPGRLPDEITTCGLENWVAGPFSCILFLLRNACTGDLDTQEFQ